MILKLIVILLLLGALINLAIAFRCLTNTTIDRRTMAKAFTYRILLSLLVFFLLMTGVSLGWITPNY